MKRHKVLLGPALIIIILSLLTISAKNSVTADLDILGPEVIKERISQPNSEDKLIYDKKKQELLAALEDYFKQALDKGLIVGAGVSVIKGDSNVIAEGFGEREFGKGNKVDGQSIFRLGSLSKGFTGILAASLVEENKINWSDKIQDYIPDFQLGSKSNTKEVTLASILSHSSGTPYHSYTDLVEAGLPMADIATLFRKIQPISKPGEIYSYQNAIFALSSEVMKKATGLEINDILHEKLFRPL
ncbi:MAG: serine hydrolase domain-containing protein, partial [Flavobacteriaceae bacterium]|nr:serine hydrolase domain-containing protein [Flavobacteriaceae bacterium]